MPKKVKACQCPFQQLAMQQVPTFFGVTLAFGPAGAALQQRLSPPQKKKKEGTRRRTGSTQLLHPKTTHKQGKPWAVMGKLCLTLCFGKALSYLFVVLVP